MTTDAMSAAAPPAAVPVRVRGLTRRFGPLTAVGAVLAAAMIPAIAYSKDCVDWAKSARKSVRRGR